MQKCEIKYVALCDHSLVTMELQINMKYPRGPGFWKFNSSLFEDDEYTEKLMFKILHFINKYRDLEDHGRLQLVIQNINRKRKKIMKKILYRKSQDWKYGLKLPVTRNRPEIY